MQTPVEYHVDIVEEADTEFVDIVEEADTEFVDIVEETGTEFVDNVAEAVSRPVTANRDVEPKWTKQADAE